MTSEVVLITEHEKVRKNWGKTAQDIQEDVKYLKEWCGTQKHLPEIPGDNAIEFLLTNCKYSMEKTKRNIDMYYTIRSLLPEVYENPNSPGYHALLEKQGDFIVLPKLTDTLHRITLLKFNPEEHNPYNMIAHQLNLFEIRTHEDLVMGEILLVDTTDITMGHVVKYTPTLIKKIIFLEKAVFSSRASQIHVLKPPEYFNIVMTTAKGILKKKLYDRIHLHANLESLHEYLHPDVLPINYGGTQKSIEELRELWKGKMKQYSKRFDDLGNMKIDELLRPEPTDNSEILGYQGSFKKIDID